MRELHCMSRSGKKKKAYKDEATARRHIDLRHFQPYRCRDCKKWHATSIQPPQRNKKNMRRTRRRQNR